MLQADQLEGEIIGKYRIEKLVGEGGMAYVYRAVHQDFDQPVAVKVLFPEHARQEETKKRFKREAWIQFKLRHPNLVRVHEIIDEQGLLGMVMDWVEGVDLKDFLDAQEKPLPFRDILRIFLPVLDVVGHAHDNQIIHRDLKPANIVLEGKRGREIPRVMDFGIAKSFADTGWKTRTGLILGTPHYMAPEQALNKPLANTVDIYALGIMLYRMVTNHLPFDAEDAVGVIMAHCSTSPPPPSLYVRDLNPQLEAIILKAIAKKPKNRFQSCEDFAAALEALPAHEIVLEPASSTSQQEISSSKPPQQEDELPTGTPSSQETTHKSSKVIIISLVLILLLLSGGIGFLLYERNKSHPSKNNISPSPSKRTRTSTKQSPPKQAQIQRPKRRLSQAQTASSQRKQPVQRIAPRPRSRKIVAIPPRKRGKRRFSCKKRSFRTCLQCVSRNFRKINRPDVLNPTKILWICRANDYLSVARRCAKACSCDYWHYCSAYYRQKFHPSMQERRFIKAIWIRVCRSFVYRRYLLKKLRRFYYKHRSRKDALICRRIWKKIK